MINNLHLILDFEKLYSSISSLVYKNRWSKEKDVNYSYCHISRTWCKRHQKGASLVRQWIRIHLAMQETQFPSLVQEDTTCHGVTGLVHHNYWAWALETISHNYRACTRSYWSRHALEPMLCSSERPAQHNEERPPFATIGASPCNS